MDDKLINDLVSRVAQELPYYKLSGRGQAQGLFKKNEVALVEASGYKINAVASQILVQLELLAKVPPSGSEENILRVLKSQLYLLKLLQRCLDSNLAGEKRVRNPDTYASRALEESLAKNLYSQIVIFLTKPPSFLQEELKRVAANCLFELSSSNYDHIIGNMTQCLTGPNLNEEEILLNAALLENTRITSQRLTNLLTTIGGVLTGLKKSNLQIAFSKLLRTIIWNWIDHCPLEFVSLCKSGERLPGNPDQLFDIFDGWASNTAKKQHFWPVCTLLLVLCPDLLLKIVREKAGTKDLVPKEKFLDNLAKALKSGKLTDVACVCYTDISRTSTYVSKNDVSALRYIITAVGSELMEKLFENNRPVSSDPADEEMMVNALLSSFYLSPRKLMNSLIVNCVKSTNSQHKRVLVTMLLKMASEKNPLPWNPTIADIYPLHATNLRQLFQDLVGSVREYDNVKGLTDKKAKTQIERIHVDVGILTKLTRLYKVDPKLALHPMKTPNQDLEDIRILLTGLCDCVAQFDIPHLSEAASETLLRLHEPEYIQNWSPNAISGFWNITSSVTISLASIVVDNINLSPKHLHSMISLLENILTYRNHFLFTTNIDITPDPASKSVRLLASTKLESVFLLHLGSSSTEIVSKCANCFKLLCDEIDVLRNHLDETENCVISNYDAYRNLGDVGMLSTGRQAQQKAIRTMLKRVDRQTAGNFAAWDEVNFRWQTYSAVVKANEDTAAKKDEPKRKKAPEGLAKILFAKNPPDVLSEWTNLLGVLCSLSAVTMNKTGGRMIGGRNIKSTGSGPDEFLTELMDLLVSEYVSIRETCKMMLGSALSPPIFPVLFRVLHTQAKNRIFAQSGQVISTPDALLFVDQSISILRLVLESDDQDLVQIADFEELILSLIRFIRQLTLSANSLQTRHKLCGLIDAIIYKRHALVFRNEYLFRTELVENIMEWTSEFSAKESNIPADLVEPQIRQVKKLIKELDLQVLLTMQNLLKALPLHGKDDDAKSTTFSKLFNFFTNLLTRCKKAPQSVVPQLPEATIGSISNLVSANIEHGLDYFVTMGYHSDYETRSAFLKVLGNILKERSNFDASDDAHDKYYKLMELISAPGLDVVLQLCEVTPVTESEQTAQVLVNIFESNEQSMTLLKAVIVQEIQSTQSANTLFRRNSMATNLLDSYCKLVGRDYLRESLFPQIRSLMSKPLATEIDPSKLGETEALEQNQKNVRRICKRFLTDIRGSMAQCPAQFREICHFLKESVSEKFPGAEHTAIAGFMFLRYFCPAIVSPDGFGVVDSPIQDKDLRRTLVIVAKVIQNLANRVLVTKEPYMQYMNSFIESNLPVIRRTFDQFAILTPTAPVCPSVTFSDEQHEEDMKRLHFFLSTSFDKMTARFAGAKPSQDGSINTIERLTAVLSQLGAPPDITSTSRKNVNVAKGSLSKKAAKANAHYEQFMERMQSRNVDHFQQRNIFFPHGKTKSGLPVLYYVARNFTVENSDMDLFNFFLLKTAQPFLANPYSLVIDLTMFSSDNQLPLNWISSLYTNLPTMANAQLDSVYIINPNTFFRKYSSRIAKFTSRINKRVHFFISPSKLFQYIAEDQCGLPAETLTIEQTIKSTFSPVTKVGQYNKKVDLRVMISTDILQIVSAKSYQIFGSTTPVIDLIHISKISEITPYKENEFIIKYDVGGQGSLLLISNSSDQIIQQLTASKDRYQLSQPQKKIVRTNAFRPSDVPGTLLNMALLNLTVPNHALRIAAYHLLVALCGSFAFKINSKLVEAYLAVPKNSKHFVERISAELAKSEPSMTVEFLQQSLGGIAQADKVSQILVLDYIKPWLRNLEIGANTSIPEAKLIDTLNSLIALSIRETELAPMILAKVWKVMGRFSKLLDAVIQCLLDRAIPSSGISQLGTKTMDCFEDIIATIGSQSASPVAGKLINLLLAELEKTGSGQDPRIEHHPSWVRIEALIRWLLVLSFDNLICVDQYLPELLHVVVLTFYSGDSLIRANVHALFVNIAHSICSSRLCHPEKLQQFRFYFADFQKLESRLHFGVGGSKSNFSPFQRLNEREEKLDVLPIHFVEAVAGSLFNFLNFCTPNANCIGTPLHARWLSLTSKTAFTANLYLQPRAICALGVLCTSPSLFSDRLISNLLRLLRDTLQSFSEGRRRDPEYPIGDLPISIILSLSRMIEHIRPGSRYYDIFFWIAISLCTIHDPKLFMPCVQLLENIIKTLSYQGAFKGRGISEYFMKSRKGDLEAMLNKLDQLGGLSFVRNFSFSVGGHLLKGLKNPTTKAPTAQLLYSFVELASENNISQLLGYLGALLPHRGDDINTHLRQMLLQANGETGSSSLFNPVMIPDKTHASLLFTLLVTILRHSEVTHEQLYVFRLLEDGVLFVPDASLVTFDVLMNKMNQMLTSTQTTELLNAILSIMNSINRQKLSSSSVPAAMTQKYLKSIGFEGLPESDHFNSKQTDQFLPIVCKILDTVLLDS